MDPMPPLEVPTVPEKAEADGTYHLTEATMLGLAVVIHKLRVHLETQETACGVKR